MKKEISVPRVAPKHIIFGIVTVFLNMTIDILIDNDFFVVAAACVTYLMLVFFVSPQKHHLEMKSNLEYIKITVKDINWRSKIKTTVEITDLKSQTLTYKKQIDHKYDDLKMKILFGVKTFRYISVIEAKKENDHIIVRIDNNDIYFTLKK